MKTLDLVYEIRSRYPTVCLRGNRERYLLDSGSKTSDYLRGSKTGSLLFTLDQLRPQDFEFVGSLPIYSVIELNGVLFEIAHAVESNDRFYFDNYDDRISSAFDIMKHNCFLTGHSHKQYIQKSEGKTIINPGSIGVPRAYGYRTQYALLEFRGQEINSELYQILYDIRATIHAQFENGLVEYAPHWAISILYDVITGEEYTVKLLERVYQHADSREEAIHDESLWHRIASEMGMKFTEREILAFLDLRGK